MSTSGLNLPQWLPEQAEQGFLWMQAYPVASSIAVALAGLLLAWVVQTILRFFGRHIANYFPGDLDDRLIRILTSVVGLVIVYLSLLLAVWLLDLSPPVETALTRILLSLLVLQLMRRAMKLCAIFIDGLSHLRDRFEVIEIGRAHV